MKKKHDFEFLKRLKEEDPFPLLDELEEREDAVWYYERLTKDCGYMLEVLSVTAQSKKVCWNAIRSYPPAIRWVQNQTFWMCAYAILKCNDSMVVKYIRNQTPLICLLALWKYPMTSMQYIQTQTNLVCRYAIHQSTINYREIKNPTYPMALQAVKKSARCIGDIQPIFHSEEICEEVVKAQPQLVGELFHPPFKYYIQAVKACPLALVYIKDKDILLKIVKELDLPYIETRKKLERYRNQFNANEIDETIRRIKYIRKELL